MGSALTGSRFIAYAHRQIAEAELQLALHIPHAGACVCGQMLPCATAAAVRDQRDHFLSKIVEVEAMTSAADGDIAAPPSAAGHRGGGGSSLSAAWPYRGRVSDR